MRNRIFFPQDALDEWVADDRVDLNSEELTIRVDNRRYRVVEAVRVLREITDGYAVEAAVPWSDLLTTPGGQAMAIALNLDDNDRTERPRLILVNLALTLSLLGALVTGLLPLPVLFMIATAIALVLNYPSLAAQKARIGPAPFRAGMFGGIRTALLS